MTIKALETGKNRYRNRGILRSVYALAAAGATAGTAYAAQQLEANNLVILAASFTPAAIASTQAIFAYGNLSGNYKKFGKTNGVSSRELPIKKNILAALGYNPEPDY